ncbi:ORFL54C, partial [Human betaherpesvirus 5]
INSSGTSPSDLLYHSTVALRVYCLGSSMQRISFPND